jgi:hypothetical protein
VIAPVAHRLAVLRVLVGGFAVCYLVARFAHFWSVMDLEPRRWEPVGVIGWLDTAPDATLTRLLLVGTIGLGIAFVAGWRYRVIGPAFALALMVVLTLSISL